MIKNSTRMKLIRNAVLASLGAVALSSCHAFKDDLGPCPYTEDTKITFRYAYNMQYADLFATDVHCLDLYIFDKATEQFVTSYHELDNSKIQTGSFSISLPLEAGEYFGVVYGGTACEESSFDKLFTEDENLKYTDLNVSLKKEFYFDQTPETGDENQFLTGDERSPLRLHPMFYGIADISVKENQHNEVQIPMMRNTNTLKITLKHKNGVEFDINDYHFLLEDDNNDFNHDNSVNKTGKIKYRPYEKENITSRATSSEGYASFAISRLIQYHQPTVEITDPNGEKIEIDVLEAITALNDDYNDDDWDDQQEYLDREHKWNIEVSTGADDTWFEVEIRVIPWEVRDDNFEAM